MKNIKNQFLNPSLSMILETKDIYKKNERHSETFVVLGD